MEEAKKDELFQCWKGKIHNSPHIPQQYRGRDIYVCISSDNEDMYIHKQVTIGGMPIVLIAYNPKFHYYDSPFLHPDGKGRLYFPKEDIDVDKTQIVEMPLLPYEWLVMEKH